MTPEFGHFALVLALCVAGVQAVVPLYGATTGKAPLMRFGSTAALAQLLCLSVAFAALVAAFVTSDFSVANVANNSHSLKPMLYKVSGAWGNHEGSLLLWVTVLALFGAMVALFGRRLPPSLKARTLAVQAMVTVGFLAFMLLTSNPFARLHPAPFDGAGLNPLLQDPGLAFHPPMLYVGYVGLSIVFSFAIAALLEGRVEAAWARWVRPWTLLAWIFLTAGIALGSWWAYYELGWGGFWYWDPVENASFMPWLIATALLHSAIVTEKRDSLKSWTILLAIVGFSLSLLGTFLVRSGVLTSVHAFASDPARGVFILLLLMAATGGGFALYAWRAPSLKGGGLFHPVSREGALLLNNMLLAVAAGTVLLGTLYPLLLDVIGGGKVSVGPPWFNTVFSPLMLALCAALGVGPLLAWKRGNMGDVLRRLRLGAVVVIAVTGAAALVVWEQQALALLGFAAALWVMAGAGADLWKRTGGSSQSLSGRLRRVFTLPRAAWGTLLAHLGVAVVVAGATGTSLLTEEKILTMQPGETTEIAGYEILFQGVKQVAGPNYLALRGQYLARSAGEEDYSLTFTPERRRYATSPQETTEAAIHSSPWFDLYVVIGEDSGEGRSYVTRLYHKPLAPWLWIGSFLMVLGGLFSLSDRRLRIGAPRRRES